MTSTTRAGRRTQPRHSAPAPRTLACRTCAKRRVRCDGMSPCEACLRHAAWKGRPAPTECEFDPGVVPLPNPAACADHSGAGHAMPSTSSAGPHPHCHGSDSPSGTTPQPGSDTTYAFGKQPGKPLQKGLACISCKARRVRCDGAKPACSSCVKSAKWKREAVSCVYRADLYVQQCREEQEQEMQRRASDSDMKADSSGDDGWQAPADEVEQPPGLGLDEEDESPAPATPTYDFPDGIPTVLPAILPPLPPLPALPTLHRKTVKMQEDTDMTSSDDAGLASSASSAGSLPHQPTLSGMPDFFTASRNSSQSGITTNPPSPAVTHTETDLSSWPSPRSPLDEWCVHNGTTYPPVPYPPASALGGIDPAWIAALNAGVIPPLSLADTLESLGLGNGAGAAGVGNGANPGVGVGVGPAGFSMPSLSVPPQVDASMLQPRGAGAAASAAAAAMKSDTGFGIDATLTLPMDTPWTGAGPLAYD